MTPGQVDEVIHALELAQDDATKTVAAKGNALITANAVRAIIRECD